MTELLHIKPSAQKVLDVLRDGQPHSALEFKRRGIADAVSQRVGELNRAGYRVENVGKGGRMAVYVLREVN